MKKMLILLLLGLFPIICFGKVKSVKIYHCSWSLETFVDLSAAQVRAQADFKFEILNSIYAESFVRILAPEKMVEDASNPVRDIRLVIDVVYDDGSVVSYRASRFELALDKSNKKRAIDEAFRSRFSFLYDKLANQLTQTNQFKSG